MTLTTTRSMTITAQYPCCGKPCKLRIVWDCERRVQREVVIREHYCDPADTTGTFWQITWREVSHGGDSYLMHEVQFMDLASGEALRLFGKRRVPHRRSKDQLP